MQMVSINPEGTLLVSGAIDDWDAIRRRRIDTIVDMEGDVDPNVPELPNHLLYVYFPILDEDLPCLTKLEALARLVADLVQAGHIVLGVVREVEVGQLRPLAGSEDDDIRHDLDLLLTGLS